MQSHQLLICQFPQISVGTKMDKATVSVTKKPGRLGHLFDPLTNRLGARVDQ